MQEQQRLPPGAPGLGPAEPDPGRERRAGEAEVGGGGVRGVSSRAHYAPAAGADATPGPRPERAEAGAGAPPLRRTAALGYLLANAYLRLWAYELAAERSPARAIAVLRAWCRLACRRLRLAVDVRGTPGPEVALFVSNHRTYLDIPVLSSALPATFLAKAEVAAMPLVGRVARHTGAVFVDRDDAADRASAARALRRRLRATSVIAFPEGTTWARAGVGPFAPGPFRLAHRARIGVVPVTVRYSDRRAYWVEDVGVWEHLRRHVLCREPLRCTVHVGARIDPAAYADAADFTRAVHDAVAAPIATWGELA